MNKDNNTFNQNISNEQNEKIIQNASKLLGKDPSQLQNAMDNGTLKKLIGSLSPKQSENLNKALSDEEYAKKILSTPQAQALIKKLMK